MSFQGRRRGGSYALVLDVASFIDLCTESPDPFGALRGVGSRRDA